MAEEYKGDVVFIGISDNRDTIDDVRGYEEEFAVPYPLALEQEVWEAYGIPYQPVTVVLAPDGKEVHRVQGPIYYEDLKGELESLL